MVRIKIELGTFRTTVALATIMPYPLAISLRIILCVLRTSKFVFPFRRHGYTYSEKRGIGALDQFIQRRCDPAKSKLAT